MSQQDNFVPGFIAGAVVGGIVGGVVGVLVSSRLASVPPEEFSKLESPKGKRQLKAPTEQSIERARQGLEDKIAQLNEAIDEVRQQLGSVNGAVAADGERAIVREP